MGAQTLVVWDATNRGSFVKPQPRFHGNDNRGMSVVKVLFATSALPDKAEEGATSEVEKVPPKQGFMQRVSRISLIHPKRGRGGDNFLGGVVGGVPRCFPIYVLETSAPYSTS